MKLFNKTGKAKKKWHRKALMVNPNRTKIIFVATAAPKRKHVPPWIYRKELDPSFKDLLSMSNIRKQYCGPFGYPDNDATAMKAGLPF
jgi:hypothetical protein